MTTIMKGKRTYEVILTSNVDWTIINVINDLLKEARIDAKFSTEEELVKDMGKTHEGTRITLLVHNFDRGEQE